METVKKEEQGASFLPWIVPLIALAATAWLVYKTVSEAGTEIVVNFTDGSSLKQGKTFVKYKGFNVGKVTSLTVADDLQSINAHIKLNHEVGNIIARENTDFWIVEPKVTVSEISGLDTIIGGSYIEIRSPVNSLEEIEKLKQQYSFKGHSEKPLKYYGESGVNFILESSTAQDIKKGTVLFYKNLETGKVLGTKLKGDSIEIYANIDEKYKHLVNSSTKFYTNSGVKINASLDGIELDVNSLASIIGGGISFETLDENAPKITKDQKFKLFGSREDVNIDTDVITFNLENADGLKEGSKIVYKGFQIGKLTEITYENDKITATAKVDKKYSYLVTDRSKFYKAVANIETLNFHNLGTIVKGSFISLIYKKGKKADTFKLYSSYRDLELEDMTIIKLKANRFANLNIGSDLYYKNIVIGRVLNVEFTKDFKHILVDVSMEKKYNGLLNDKTLFYIISTPLIEAENFDFTVNFERVKPFLFGGIGIEYYPSDYKNGGRRYWLYDSNLEMNKERKSYRKGLRIPIEVDEDTIVNEDISVMFNNVKIGSVESFNPLSTPPKVTVFIEEKYRKYIKPFSKFYKKSAIEVKADFSGVDLKVNNLADMLRGSIIVDNNIDSEREYLHKGFKYKLYKDYESLPVKRGKRFTLYTEKGLDLSTDSKIYYKKIEIGSIEDIKLSSNAKEIIVQIIIYDKYRNLIRDNTIFYNASGIDIDLSLTGADIRAENMQSILKGGIAVVTPNETGNVAQAKKRFLLNSEIKEDWLQYNPEIKLY